MAVIQQTCIANKPYQRYEMEGSRPASTVAAGVGKIDAALLRVIDGIELSLTSNSGGRCLRAGTCTQINPNCTAMVERREHA